jgi:hypothetical protein
LAAAVAVYRRRAVACGLSLCSRRAVATRTQSICPVNHGKSRCFPASVANERWALEHASRRIARQVIAAPRSLSDLGLIYCAGGRAAHSSPIFRSIAPLCASKSGNSVLALPPCSLRSPKSDRLLGITPLMAETSPDTVRGHRELASFLPHNHHDLIVDGKGTNGRMKGLLLQWVVSGTSS